MPYRRNGRTLKVIPAAHLASMAAGAAVRAGARAAANYARGVGMRKAAAYAGAGALGTTAATVGLLGKRKAERTIARPKKYSRTVSAAPQAGEFGEVINVKAGRPRRLNTSKLAALSIYKRIMRWQRVNPMQRQVAGTPPGAIQLKNEQGATFTEVPVHLYCLNSTGNNVASSGNVCYRLFVNDNGTLDFRSLEGQSPTGVLNAFEWTTEWKNNVQGGAFSRRYISQQWYDIRFLCYGARAQPTKYEISLIKMKNAWLDPLESPSNAQEAADRQALWQGLAQQMMVNPIMPIYAANYIKAKYTVVKKVVFTLQPSLNTEVDASPASRVVKMFVPDGKIYDYQYHGDGFTGTGADNNLNTVNYTSTGFTSAEYQEFPKPRDRMWLMIRCLDTTDSGTITDANTGSYDVVIRKKEAAAVN